MDPETATLTQSLTRCDEAAWFRFHESYYSWLGGRVRARGVAECDAPEMIQRIYLRVIRHVRVFETRDGFEAWLSCLARCEVIDAARRSKRRSWLGERFQQWQEARSAPEETRRSERLHEAIGQLADSDRTLVSRHYLEGWSQEELAVDAGTSVKAVESKLARLRSRLRNQLSLPENP